MAQSSCTLEDTLDKACKNIGQCCSERYEKCEENIRNAPIASVLFAGVAGYFLHFLPVGCILGGAARLLLALLKPAVFVFGVWKLVDYARSNSPAPVSSEDPGRNPVIDSPPGPV